MGAPDDIEPSDSDGVSWTPLVRETLEVDAVTAILGAIEFGIFVDTRRVRCPDNSIPDRLVDQVSGLLVGWTI